MKILQIHKDFQVRGGASRYFFEVSRLLEKNGHQIAFFSTSREGNEPSPWSKYFIPYLSYGKVDYRRAAGLFTHMIYSSRARKNISLLLDEFHPDIVHLHSIYHQLSPSILYEIYKRRIPAVMTVHDFHLIAPSHTLFHDGKICEITMKKDYYKALFHKCVKGSYMASLADAVEHYIHDATGIYTKSINLFIASSRFYAKKMASYGIPGNKIKVLHNFSTPPVKETKRKRGSFVLYAGRLSQEKGLDILLEAAAHLPPIPFLIAGGGPQYGHLRKIVKERRLKNVTLAGYLKSSDIQSLIDSCRFLVLPSQCFDNCPLSIFEAFASGKPVVASRIGGIPELINTKNGVLFSPDNAKELALHIKKLWTNESLTLSLGKQAREDAQTRFNSSGHYQKLISIYKNIIQNNGETRRPY